MNNYQDLLQQQEIISGLVADTRLALYAMQHQRENAWQDGHIDDVIDLDRLMIDVRDRLWELEYEASRISRQILWEDTKMSLREFVRKLRKTLAETLGRT